jgi:hypothetical protein
MVVLNVGKISQQVKQVKKNLLFYLMNLLVEMMMMELEIKPILI